MTTLSGGRSTEGDKPHWIEWVTGIMATVLVIGLVGWIAVEAVTRGSEQPDLGIRNLSVEETESGYSVRFEVENSAKATAAAVVIRAQLLDGETPVEEADVTFDFVPAQSSVGGAFVFLRDPQDFQLRIRPIGFTDP